MQDVHDDRPVVAPYCPATHDVHDASADVEYFPMPHVKQVLTEVAPTVAEYSPDEPCKTTSRSSWRTSQRHKVCTTLHLTTRMSQLSMTHTTCRCHTCLHLASEKRGEREKDIKGLHDGKPTKSLPTHPAVVEVKRESEAHGTSSTYCTSSA